jgi:uncharacterized LabA/DUF88 family protein
MPIKISLFIVTYDNDKILQERALSSIDSSEIPENAELQITIINNFGHLNLPEKFKYIKIINNEARPDWSTGHLARNWNQGLLHGFKNLNNPISDIVVLCQNDVSFLPNWVENLIELHKQYEFIQMGGGDEFHSYLPNHIKKVGMWDERFCGIGFQEADYFLRSVIRNAEKATINDRYHARIHKAVENTLIRNLSSGRERDEPHHLLSGKTAHGICHEHFRKKWNNREPHFVFEEIKKQIVENILYPYFEDAVDSEVYLF